MDVQKKYLGVVIPLIPGIVLGLRDSSRRDSISSSVIFPDHKVFSNVSARLNMGPRADPNFVVLGEVQPFFETPIHVRKLV